jgi:WD40 repeat protein
MEIAGDSALTLDRLGECRITDLITGTTTFSYSSLGLRTLTFTSERTVIVGSSRSVRWNTTLLHLDPGTGETVPINDSNIITFALAFDPVTRQLYSLGIEQVGGRPRTVLKAHYGRTFDRSRTLMSYPGEDLDATLVLGNDGTVYTSLGDAGVRSISWGETLDFENDGKLHRVLKIAGSWLISLNSDSSITVWDLETRDKLLDFYLFDDLNWAAISSEGGYYTSAGTDSRILFYQGAEIVEREPNEFTEDEEEPEDFMFRGF